MQKTYSMRTPAFQCSVDEGGIHSELIISRMIDIQKCDFHWKFLGVARVQGDTPGASYVAHANDELNKSCIPSNEWHGRNWMRSL
jgi:hypothetical protein